MKGTRNIPKLDIEFVRTVHSVYLESNLENKELIQQYNLSINPNRLDRFFNYHGFSTKRQLGLKIPLALKHSYDDESLIRNQGIYMVWHTDHVDGGCYIGACKNKEGYDGAGFLRRWRGHLDSFKRGEHHCNKLQLIVNKYGLEGVRFSVLEILSDSADFDMRERFWITQYKSFENGYNMTEGGIVGYKFSKDSRNRRTGNERPNSIPVFQYDLEGNFIKMWESGNLAATSLGIDSGGLASAAKGIKSQQYKSYRWYYEFLGDKIEPLRKWAKQLIPVAKYDLLSDEKLAEFQSIVEAAASVGAYPTNLAKAAREDRVCKGFKWKILK